MSIEVQAYHLKVLSSLTINISGGFVLLAIAAKDLWVLTGNISFAILFLLASFKLEQILDEL